MSGAPLLEIKGLRAGYGETEVLHGIDLSLSEGEFVCIIGANTAGKSTILRSISRLVPHTSGVLNFAGADLLRCAPHEVPKRGIAHVPEGRQIFADLTVEENLLLGAFTARRAPDLHERMDEILKLFPRLRERFAQSAGTLSGGEQQMVALGRGLVAAPRLLLLDEPSLGLAPIVVKTLFAALSQIVDRTPVLLVEQNSVAALEVCQSAYVLVKGSIVMRGSADDMTNREALIDSYLGQTALTHAENNA
jgi:branched-chain amino acid transport system ATP-binding protein